MTLELVDLTLQIHPYVSLLEGFQIDLIVQLAYNIVFLENQLNEILPVSLIVTSSSDS